MYVHITMLPEACPTRKWKASVSNIGLTLEEDPLLLNVGTLHNQLTAQTPQEVELDPGSLRMRSHPQAGLSLDSLCQHQVWRPQYFNWQLRLLETFTRFVLHLYRRFLKLVHSYRTQCVKEFSRDGKYGPGHLGTA